MRPLASNAPTICRTSVSQAISSIRSFLASLAPDLRQEILLTADDGVYQFAFSTLCSPWLHALLTFPFLAFISTLPVTLIAEANVLRERVASQQRQRAEGGNGAHTAARPTQQSEGQPVTSRGRRQRNGKLVSRLAFPPCFSFVFCFH